MTQPQLLGDRYAPETVIGRGGMAEVWKSHDTRLNRDVAIKRLRVDLASDPTFQARFHREAKAAAGLSHPNIVAVYDTGEQPEAEGGVSVPYIVMELVPGHTLRDLLRDGRQIVPAKALEFTQGVLDALAYSHRAGIVHRDIKPANVMITTGGAVKVMDFGIARAVSDTAATMTQTAAVIGTAQYLSPEQARGEKVDARSDIYSSGCLLYELLTNRPPFQGDSPVSVAYQHVRETPVPPSQVDPELTPEMDAVVLKALAKNPEDRYQSAEEMRTDIARLLAGIPVAAVIPPAPATEVVAVAQENPTQVVTVAQPGPPRMLPDDDPYADEGGSGRRTWLYVILVLLVAALLAVSYAAYNVFFSGPTVPSATPTPTPSKTQLKVPSLIGLNEQAARSTLTNNGLQVGEVVTLHGPDDDTKGTVVQQSVQPDELVAEGTKVGFTINIGPEQGTVPDVTGKSKDEATKELTEAGFKVVAKNDDPRTEDTRVAAGSVTTQDPDRNAQAEKGATVTITIATGKSILPNVIGKTEAEAANQLAQAGFAKTPQIELQESTAPAGTVISQVPDTTGEATPRTTEITLVIAVAPSETPTPPPTSSAPPVTDPPSDPPQS